jgi:hypothetical protein
MSSAKVEDVEPDIKPLRLGPIDVITLTDVERTAILVHLAGSTDPVVADAVVEATRKVLERSRGGGEPTSACRW